MGISWLLPGLLGLPWVGAAVVALWGERPRLRLRADHLACAFAAVSWLPLLLMLGQVKGSDTTLFRAPWIPTVGINLALRLDALSLPLVVNVLAVSLLALWYGLGYLRDKPRLHVCNALLLAFMGSMLGTLLADDALLFLVFWEGMLVASSLLIGGWGEGENRGRITLKYFLYTQIGSLLLLVALARLVGLAGSSDLSVIAAKASELPREEVRWIAALMVIGFCVKLAVFPVHAWLPDAHSVAPMPVTVMLAAAMLSMGAYGILRFPLVVLHGQGFEALQLPLMILALVSQVYGALMALASHDIKRIVAYSSVSQMGYVVFALASLNPQGMGGAVFHVLSHGILKALLFMGVGLVMHATGRRQLEELGGLYRTMPGVMAGLSIGAIAIAGLPPFCGFHSEWLIFTGGIASRYPVLGYIEVLIPLLTAGYAVWFAIRLALGTSPKGILPHPDLPAMSWPFYVLVILALVVGIFPAPVYAWVMDAAALLLPGGGL